MQPNGRIVIGGAFTEYDGAIQRRIARLVAGDTSFPHNEGSELVYDSTADTDPFTFSWMARAGYYYFVQHSEDLENWEWLPIVEPGFGQRIEYGFASNLDRFFLRLIYTFDPQAPVMQTDFNETRVSTWDEIQLGTDPFEWVDSTGNGLPDAWELYHFGELGVDPNADPDGDGLTNYEEYLHGTDPNKWDTDGDLLSDAWEIQNGTDPLDPNDNGLPPNATDIAEVEFTIGDPSVSRSEKWRMMIIGEGPDDFREMGFHNQDFAAIRSETVKLLKGNGYRITISHVATNRSQGPDYDWAAQVGGKPETKVLKGNETHEGDDRFFVLENHWIVDNEDGLLGRVDQSFGPVDHTVGKEALLIPAGKFRADDGKIHHGFSPPNTEQEEEADVYWASVIQNETNTIVNFIAEDSEIADLLRLHIPPLHEGYVDISPKTFTGPETDLTITGTDAAGGAIHEAQVHVVMKDDQSANPDPLLVLNVMVLPKRGPISVGIYHIEDNTSPDTLFATSPAVAKANPAAVVQVLNDAFKQAGVTFELHGSSGDFDVQYDTDELVSDTSNPNLHFWQVAPGSDGRLNSSEQPTIYEDRTWEANIPVFLVKQSGIPYNPFDPNPLFVRAGSSSLSEGQPPQAFVALKDSLEFVELVIAHEIGHVLGLSTANDDEGNHDNPPYPAQVISDVSNLKPPLPPPGHLSEPEPNSALMQGGAPVDGLLPWPWGRWMRHQDWREANELAGDHF